MTKILLTTAALITVLGIAAGFVLSYLAWTSVLSMSIVGFLVGTLVNFGYFVPAINALAYSKITGVHKAS